ncbi:glycoside hydrolase family 31 protein [Sphaerobolus stellatus SS14]|nr:glycoside hydrolase family 31 protein [Sphaerobolus stellatus SS14]
MSLKGFIGLVFLIAATCCSAAEITIGKAVSVDDCPGYVAENITTTESSLNADLVLGGTACNIYGNDIQRLKLSVIYEDVSRIHVKITDPNNPRYEVPESVLPRPKSKNVPSTSANIQFKFITSPFSFSVVRKTNEVLFDTKAFPLVYEPQYLRVKATLPKNANLYGLGEHTDSFRLPTTNYTRTLWSRDAYEVPMGTNLYGNHPVYFEHRSTGTHGVFLLNSNGMDIKIDDSHGQGTTLEYNIIGGILDFYFISGPSPVDVAKQYAAVVGKPAKVPYWSFGFHQCRFNYTDYVAVADVITNYSAAGIPLETMWTDIDYMDRRRTFTNDPEYFPTERLREIISYLHSHSQHYIMMVDPAVAYLENQSYGPFDRGLEADIFLKNPNGTIYKGLVWPGVTAFPDWFNPKIQDFWTGEFQRFFDPGTGFDIDGVWLDMNEPSSFCNFPCDNPEEQAQAQGLPPSRSTPPPPPDVPIFQTTSNSQLSKRQQTDSGTLLLNPPYALHNAAGSLSNKTAYTNVKHSDGHVMYDTHNLYGTMMSAQTRMAMEARRPGLRPLAIVRSTFAGAGTKVGKWLGDNVSLFQDYRFSIAGQLGMAAIYQIPMVGSDVCGYAGDTTEFLCARWMMLGAFSPFYRNHNSDTSIAQEAYRWPLVAEASRNAMSMRYRLMDYLYTAFHKASIDGTPVLNPLWYLYPDDPTTWPIELQFFFGDAILVSPVTQENSTSVDIYLPNDTFYDFNTLIPVHGQGKTISLTNVNFTTIPVHIRSGVVLPLRIEDAMTTEEVREKDFELVVAQNAQGDASGSLILDDGVSLTQKAVCDIQFKYAMSKLTVSGLFGFKSGVKFARTILLNIMEKPLAVKLNGRPVAANAVQYNGDQKIIIVDLDLPMTRGFTLELE